MTVESNPFQNLIIQPWAEDVEVQSSSPAGETSNWPEGHVGWVFHESNATVMLSLDAAKTTTSEMAC